MSLIKTPEDIEKLRESGKRLAFILDKITEMVRVGVAVKDLNEEAHRLMTRGGDKPAFLGYKPSGAPKGFPSSLCVSINDGLVHGESSKSDYVINEGDVVKIDGGLNHKGRFTDMARTIAVGSVSPKVKEVIEVTKIALQKGIEAAKVGNTVGDIGFAIESFVAPYKFGIIRDLAGHGVGHAVHEEPLIPNFGRPGKGEKLKAGMVIAIEPMLTLGGEDIKVLEDGFTYGTEDGSIGTHFEHTILITEDGPEILTKQ
ncbi:MAG: type I methionyl aminopeptidase [Parcubacteria group bacterium CG11_big_fil_rev_8_21_14_0_20_39_22]|nr:MAG: type I methionyl aminopeptidase [Parcubacteria group bacterium CG11_big_fil_rev_8_21_14_0_20_39_22]